ncbi:unnamed protein product, partial [marine sediment metagenome]
MNNSPLPLVLVSHTLPEGWLEILNGRCRMISGPKDADHLSSELRAYISQADGLFTLLTIKVDEDLLSQAANIKVVSNMAVGFDNIDVAACTKRGIPVGNTPG